MAFARGKRSLAISDRSGMQFPYLEMVKEWNGSIVHISEYESKHPQLDPPYHPADPQGLKRPRADVRPGGGCLVQLDLYYWPGQFTNIPNSMQPGISGDIINAKRVVYTAVGDVTISSNVSNISVSVDVENNAANLEAGYVAIAINGQVSCDEYVYGVETFSETGEILTNI